MSHYQEEEIGDTIDDYDMADVEDDLDEDCRSRMDESESDYDDEIINDPRIRDTSSAQARRGKDIQGIPWDRLNITRDKYRQTRLQQYKNYENVPTSGEKSEKECKPTQKGGIYYEFRRNTRAVKSTILHFQLRNLIWATSKHDVYLMSHYSIIHWSALTSKRKEILNVSGHVAPCEKHPGSLLEGFTQTQVSTLAIRNNLLVAGGFQGELICKFLNRTGISFCTQTTYDENAITNAIQIYDSSRYVVSFANCRSFSKHLFIEFENMPSGAVRFMASNNDCGVRDFDLEKFELLKCFQFQWPVNYTSLSPDGKAIVVMGDDPKGLLVDSKSGKTIQELHGHLDYSFASAWHPHGHTFATGNQDMTCRIWDMRNLSKSVAVLRGNLGAVRSIRFTSDGRFMAMAEPADFVHIFDVGSCYEKQQEVDFFGEISGISFSPDTEALFIGVWDRTYGSLLQYSRCRNYSYLDSMF